MISRASICVKTARVSSGLRERRIGYTELLAAEATEKLPGHLLAQDAGVSLHEIYFGGESLLCGFLFQESLPIGKLHLHLTGDVE